MKKIPWGEFSLGLIIGFFPAFIIGKIIFIIINLDINWLIVIELLGVFASLSAIWAVFRSTDKQIRNQNKENHRPYLLISEANDRTELPNLINYESYNPYYVVKTKKLIENTDLEISSRGIVLKIFNKGYGVAHDIMVYSLDDRNDAISIFYRQSRSVSSTGIIDIAKDGDKDILFYISYNINMDAYDIDSCYFVLFYSDLYHNVYSTIVYISFNNNGLLQCRYHNEETTDLGTLLAERTAIYLSQKQRYLDKKKAMINE